MSLNTVQGPKARSNRIILTSVMVVGAALMLFPFYWLVIASTHTTADIFSSFPPLLPGSAFWDNMQGLFVDKSFGRNLVNSLAVSIAYVFLSGTVCVFAGYAFAKFNFRGQKLLFGLILISLAIPSNVTLVPLFKMMVLWGWLDTYHGLLLPGLALPFGIFLMRQTLLAVPDEILQSARIDGAGELRVFFAIVLPTMKPALAALGIYLFLAEWNSFIWPLVLLRTPETYTIPVALASLLGVARSDYGQLLAGTLISVLPVAVLFIFLQRHFVSGILAGAVKQ